MDCGLYVFACVCVCVCGGGGLLYCQYLYCISSNDRMFGELWIRKDLEGSGRGLIEVLSQHFPGGPEENYENPSQDSGWPGRDSGRAPLEYRSGGLLQDQPLLIIPSATVIWRFCYWRREPSSLWLHLPLAAWIDTPMFCGGRERLFSSKKFYRTCEKHLEIRD
jgi:hypothetical protein